jgi:hypothetical protein
MATIISFPGAGKRASSAPSAARTAAAEVLSFPGVRSDRCREAGGSHSEPRRRRQRDRLEILE